MIRALGLAVLAAALGACTGGRPVFERVSDLASDEVVLVGRVELVPPLVAAEQELHTLTSDRFRGRGHAILTDRLLDLDDLPLSAGSESVFFELGKDFYVHQPRVKELYYSGSVILMKSTQTGHRTVEMGQLKLPGRVKFRMASSDRAVYIGTLRYHRDDYNAITKVELIDDYARASQEFARKFGGKLKLRRLEPERVK